MLNSEHNVEYGGVKSVSCKSTSGVPQKFNLGPLLFLIFISDISVGFSTQHLFFANDLQINSFQGSPIRPTSPNDVNNWCHDNKCELHIFKCKVIFYHRKNNLFSYNIGKL